MTAGEFRAWMDGFLIGKTTLTRKDVETIRAKSQEVADISPYVIRWYPHVPYTPPTWTTTTSAAAGNTVPITRQPVLHRWPLAWSC